ncbi:MAG: cyclophilin-like fold protein [Candidatus Hermodarchaeia archaeon]
MKAPEFTSKIPVEFILSNDLILEGELRSVLSPRTIEKLLKILPINSRIHLWKQELYFEIGIRMGSEKGVASCKAGDIAYWPQGDAICLFFEDMKPYGKVNPLGQISSNNLTDVFSSLRSGMPISFRKKAT